MLKSFFIPIWMMGLAFLLYYSALKLFQADFRSLFWWSLFCATALGPLFMASLFVFKRVRTPSNLTAWTVFELLAIGLGVGAWWREQIHLTAPLLGLGMLGGAWLLYVYWYSRLQKPENTPLKLGQPLPEMVFVDLHQREVKSSGWLGKPVLILFYRGNWCPLCMAQIQEVAKQYRELSEWGVQIALISPQDQAHSQALADKFSVPMQFLTDPQGAMAQKLDIFHAWGLPTGMQVLGYDKDTVLPTVMIVDAAGIVQFVEIADNYRVRPEPRVFIEILKRHRILNREDS
ncbi:MAG: peroxiredoxin family protein [Candidatus Sericytochromatia bacterium]